MASNERMRRRVREYGSQQRNGKAPRIGVRAISQFVDFTWSTSRSLPDVRQWAERALMPALHDFEYRPVSRSADGVVLMRVRRHRPVLLFSVFAYLANPGDREQVAIRFGASPDGLSRMDVVGVLPKSLGAVLKDLPQATAASV